jgi:hypothetical protein
MKLELLQAQIFAMQAKFRILQGWRIYVEDDGEHYAEVQVHAWGWGREVVIRPYHPGEEVPEGYVLHEMLHAALSILQGCPVNAWKETEEELVQDLCVLVQGGE